MEKEYQSELIIPKSERAPIAPAIPPEELAKIKVALVTSGGNRSSWQSR